MLKEQITQFIVDPASHDFDELARRAFEFQYKRMEPYRRLCQGQELTPDRIEDWRSIPPVPVLAYKSLTLATEPAEEIFLFRSKARDCLNQKVGFKCNGSSEDWMVGAPDTKKK